MITWENAFNVLNRVLVLGELSVNINFYYHFCPSSPAHHLQMDSTAPSSELLEPLLVFYIVYYNQMDA